MYFLFLQNSQVQPNLKLSEVYENKKQRIAYFQVKATEFSIHKILETTIQMWFTLPHKQGFSERLLGQIIIRIFGWNPHEIIIIFFHIQELDNPTPRSIHIALMRFYSAEHFNVKRIHQNVWISVQSFVSQRWSIAPVVQTEKSLGSEVRLSQREAARQAARH